MGLFYAVWSKWFESTHRNKICKHTIIHYLIFFLLEYCGTTRESRATYVFFMVVLIPSVRIVSMCLPCAGFDSLRKDKILFLLIHNCECIVSTQSVRIALIFHNGFFEVRFLVMEHVFYFFFRQFPMWFVRIALVFHNGFCRVRFPIMEQVFFMFLPLPCCVMQQVGVLY